MQKRLNRVFQLIAWSLVLPQISWAQSTSDDATTIFKQSSNTVITIEAADQDGVRQGSAVAIRNTRNFQTLTPDGTIFYTNWHVVKAAKKISSLIDGQRYNLEILFGDPKLDMASIKLSGGNPPVKAPSGEVEISRREFLHEEVKVFGQPDHGGAQAR